jgi:DnaK suppressor protein
VIPSIAGRRRQLAKKTSKKAAASKKPGSSKKKTTKKKAPPKKKAAAARSPSAKKKPATSKKTTTKKTPAPKKAPASSKATAPKKTTKKKAPAKKADEAKAGGSKKAPAKTTTKTKKRTAAPSGAPAAPAATPAAGSGATGPDRFRSVYKGGGSSGREAAAKLAAAAGLAGVRSSARADTHREKKYRRLTKSPLNEKQIAEFRELLIVKRRQLLGDVTSMENEALGGNGGSLSHLPQHMADQGSDTFDQSLNLDLAASQRGLLKEIDDALDRIDANLYGICELLGKPIKLERLRNTPWARFSIEAAREIEKNPFLLRKNDDD